MIKKETKSIILYLDSAAAIDYLTDEQQSPTACNGMQPHPNACHNDNDTERTLKTSSQSATGRLTH